MMIMRSQKPQILSAEGMISADLQGYGKVIIKSIKMLTSILSKYFADFAIHHIVLHVIK